MRCWGNVCIRMDVIEQGADGIVIPIYETKKPDAMAPGLCSVSFEDEILLDLSDEALEGFRFIHGQIRHHFSVEGDAFDL